MYQAGIINLSLTKGEMIMNKRLPRVGDIVVIEGKNNAFMLKNIRIVNYAE